MAPEPIFVVVSLELEVPIMTSHFLPGAASPRLPALDGIRGVAILLVVTHNLSLLTEPRGWAAHLLASVLDRGWLGVQLFFVLSGFLITGILIDSRDDPHHWLSFFGARVLRIFPLYYATLVLVFAILPLWQVGPAFAPGIVWWLAGFVSNWAPLNPGDNPLPHFWSLAVEEQFYLLWPFLIRPLGLKGIFRLCVVLTLAALAIRAGLLMRQMPSQFVYEWSVCRMDALACGAAAAVALRMPAARAWLAGHMGWLKFGALGFFLAAAVSGGFTQYSVWTQSFGYLFLSIAFTLGVLGAVLADLAQSRKPWARLLRHAWLRRLGLYSYAMYVLHVPLGVAVGLPVLHALGVQAPPADWPVALAYMLVGLAATTALGALSHHFFESHFARWKTRLRLRLARRPADPATRSAA